MQFGLAACRRRNRILRPVAVVLRREPSGCSPSSRSPTSLATTRQMRALTRPASSCHPLHQTGCGGMEKCTIAGGEIVCAPPGTTPVGLPCDVASDDCVGGTLCVDGYCRPFCSRFEGPTDGLCSVGLCPYAMPGDPPAQTCSTVCSPTGMACQSPTSCYLPLAADHETPGCLTPGTFQVGDGCQFPNHCGAGLTCSAETIATVGYRTCRKICIVAQNDCGRGESCVERSSADGFGICL